MSLSSVAPTHRTHLVPTHVHTPDVLLTLAGVSVSVRQFLLLVVGVALGYRLWLLLTVLATFAGGQVVRVGLTLVPLGVSLACAFLCLAGRRLDLWGVVVVRYLLRPRRMVWRSVRFQEPMIAGAFLGEEEP